MKKLISVLKIVLPLLAGVYIIYRTYMKLTQNERDMLYASILEANYFWVFCSLILGFLSHVSRAYRWKYLTEPLGYKFNLPNAVMAVLAGYFVNLLIPRAGELARCSMIAKYENKDINKLFGTVLGERVFDLIILSTLISYVLYTQFDVVGRLLMNMFGENLDVESLKLKAIIFMMVGLLIFIVSFFAFRNSTHPIIQKIRDFLLGFYQGIFSIFKMEHRVAFIAHTLFIWSMYLAMNYVCFLSVSEVSNLSFIVMIAAFVMGGISVVLVQGGIGLYPLAISQTLMLYGVSELSGLAIGWISWASQTAMLIILGCLSLIIMPIYNKRLNLPAN